MLNEKEKRAIKKYAAALESVVLADEQKTAALNYAEALAQLVDTRAAKALACECDRAPRCTEKGGS